MYFRGNAIEIVSICHCWVVANAGRPEMLVGGLLVVAWDRAAESGFADETINPEAPAISVASANGSQAALLPADADLGAIEDAIVCLAVAS